MDPNSNGFCGKFNNYRNRFFEKPLKFFGIFREKLF